MCIPPVKVCVFVRTQKLAHMCEIHQRVRPVASPRLVVVEISVVPKTYRQVHG